MPSSFQYGIRGSHKNSDLSLYIERDINLNTLSYYLSSWTQLWVLGVSVKENEKLQIRKMQVGGVNGRAVLKSEVRIMLQ